MLTPRRDPNELPGWVFWSLIGAVLAVWIAWAALGTYVLVKTALRLAL